MEGWSWPLHGIRLRTADLDLQVMTEADLPTLWSVLPDDVGMNPHATTYAGLDGRANRSAIIAQAYWRALGVWSPDDWALPFVVRSGGEVVGAQWLEGPDWRADRTVDSSSWLVAPARGRGLGKQMRAAVLALAFGPLRADAAVSSAVVDNAVVPRRLAGPRLPRHAPLGARALGGDAAARASRARRRGRASGQAREVVIAGVSPALPLFGIEEVG